MQPRLRFKYGIMPDGERLWKHLCGGLDLGLNLRGEDAAGGIGHTGIVDYDGAWISAGTTNVNRVADVRTYIPSRIRNYTP